MSLKDWTKYQSNNQTTQLWQGSFPPSGSHLPTPGFPLPQVNFPGVKSSQNVPAALRGGTATHPGTLTQDPSQSRPARTTRAHRGPPGTPGTISLLPAGTSNFPDPSLACVRCLPHSFLGKRSPTGVTSLPGMPRPHATEPEPKSQHCSLFQLPAATPERAQETGDMDAAPGFDLAQPQLAMAICVSELSLSLSLFVLQINENKIN